MQTPNAMPKPVDYTAKRPAPPSLHTDPSSRLTKSRLLAVLALTMLERAPH